MYLWREEENYGGERKKIWLKWNEFESIWLMVFIFNWINL